MQFELSDAEIGEIIEGLEVRIESMRDTMEVIEPEFHAQLKAEMKATRLLWARFDSALTGTEWTEEDLEEE
jgi:hypothetical protein